MQCEACNVETPDGALHCEGCGARLYRAKLRVSFEDGTTQVHHLFPNTYSIGRGEENDIVLADASVSRKHAAIEFREGGFVIRDKGSKNGSLLNGVHFTTGELRDMDCIQLGQVVLHFFDEETSAQRTEGFLGTEEFVQRAFFKFAGQNRTNLSKREAVETLLDLAATLIHADEVFLFHLDPARRLQFEVGRDRRGNPVAPESLPPESWECIHAAISSAGMEVTPCAAAGRGEKRIRCLAAPLLSQKVGGVLGVSYFGWEKGTQPPAEARKQLLATLVSHLALALENERLYDEALQTRKMKEDLALAREIQRRLLPTQLTRMNNLEICSFVQPCDAVGGDYFDIIRLSSRTVGIAIGDICGHGIPAALLSSTVQAAIRSQLEYTLSPAQVMQHLNRFLMESTADSVFVTLFLGILECKSGTLTYINAGHPPPVHISRERSVKELRARAAALGIVDQDFRCEQEVRVLAGDMLLLYTDGVIESQNKHREIYGRKRLLDVVRASCLNSKSRKPKLSELSRCIKQDVLAFMEGAKQTDDLTLVELARR